ncbi:MAG TPA: DUF4136 domain-containing protein [Sphingomonas sp.]|nr:DUF4136 domain-containing protein [Sphingomonas sp.]
MTIKRSLLALAAPLMLLTAGGCATGLSTNVSRFQRMPVPEGQTFRIEAANPANRGGIEFGQYAGDVAARLAQLGYRPVTSSGPADMIVQLDYGVDHGQQHVRTTPGFDCGWGYGPWGGPGFGWARPGWGWGWGWGGPPLSPWDCPDVESYTVYTSWLTMTITRSDGERLFEGRARAHSATDDLTRLVPDLIQAMFTNFPGNSGQDIRITVPPRRG